MKPPSILGRGIDKEGTPQTDHDAVNARGMQGAHLQHNLNANVVRQRESVSTARPKEDAAIVPPRMQ